VSDATTLRQQVTALSSAYRVLSPYTALLVLETEQDYARFGIERTSLADILTVQNGRVALEQRKDAVLAPGGKSLEKDDLQAFGMIGLSSTMFERRGGDRLAVDEKRSATGGGAAQAPLGNMFGNPVEGIGSSGNAEIPRAAAGTAFGNFGSSGQGMGDGRGSLGGGHMVVAPRIREGAVRVMGHLSAEVIQRIVRQNYGRFRLCYENGTRNKPELHGAVVTRFTIDPSGAVVVTGDAGSSLPDSSVVQCVVRGFGNLSFPKPDGLVNVVYPIEFQLGPSDARASSAATRHLAIAPAGLGTPRPAPCASGPSPQAPIPAPEPAVKPYAGVFGEIMTRLVGRDVAGGLQAAWSARARDPGDVTALIALGEALEASGDVATAARAYGSIIDLFPSSADMRRMAGERLERLSDSSALDLAVDTYAKAVAQRPDHPAGHRLLAYARLKRHEYEQAFDAVREGLLRCSRTERVPGVEGVLREDLGLIGAAWAAAEPKQSASIRARVTAAGAVIENSPSLRFVLNWETDANDVDLHVRDAAGNHAFFAQPTLASGGRLYGDVTTGYGPECFTVRLPKAMRPSPYRLQVHYYARGPMGYGMGKVEILDHDGHGGLTFVERPFVVMNDQVYVDLGPF